MEVTSTDTAHRGVEDPVMPYRLVTGLIRLDLHRIVIALTVLAAPSLIGATVERPDTLDPLILPLLRTLTATVVCLVIAGAWLGRLRRTGTLPTRRDYLAAGGAAFVLGQLPALPFLAPFLPLPPGATLTVVLLSIPALMLAWRHCLLPAALLAGIRPFDAAVRWGRAFTLADPWLPARLLLPTIAVKLILTGLSGATDPDGRLALTAFLSGGGTGAGALLGTYLALGFIILRLPEKSWNDLQLDPYRQARTTTLAVRSSMWVARKLTPQMSALGCAIGILLWGANSLRANQITPATELSLRQITLAAIDTDTSRVTVSLDATDSTHRFRGFQPIFFAIAGESGFAIARPPTGATIPGEHNDMRFALPRDRDSTALELSFVTGRSLDELARLDALYLWYRQVRLFPVDLKRATITQTQPVTEESSVPTSPP